MFHFALSHRTCANALTAWREDASAATTAEAAYMLWSLSSCIIMQLAKQQLCLVLTARVTGGQTASTNKEIDAECAYR